MTTKISLLKEAAKRGDWRAALRIASRFEVLGEHKAAIMKGWEAVARPGFQRQLRRDPKALIKEGIKALKARYKLDRRKP